MIELIEDIAKNANVPTAEVAAVLAYMHGEGYVDYGVIAEANEQAVGG